LQNVLYNILSIRLTTRLVCYVCMYFKCLFINVSHVPFSIISINGSCRKWKKWILFNNCFQSNTYIFLIGLDRFCGNCTYCMGTKFVVSVWSKCFVRQKLSVDFCTAFLCYSVERVGNICLLKWKIYFRHEEIIIVVRIPKSKNSISVIFNLACSKKAPQN